MDSGSTSKYPECNRSAQSLDQNSPYQTSASGAQSPVDAMEYSLHGGEVVGGYDGTHVGGEGAPHPRGGTA